MHDPDIKYEVVLDITMDNGDQYRLFQPDNKKTEVYDSPEIALSYVKSTFSTFMRKFMHRAENAEVVYVHVGAYAEETGVVNTCTTLMLDTTKISSVVASVTRARYNLE